MLIILNAKMAGASSDDGCVTEKMIAVTAQMKILKCAVSEIDYKYLMHHISIYIYIL